MTLDCLYSLLESTVSGEEIRDFAADYRQFPLGLGYSDYGRGIRHLGELYQHMGLESELLSFPADGKTVYGDRHFPLAWDIDEAWAEVSGERIADYRVNSYSVVPFSADSGGVCEKKLVPLEELPEGNLAEYAALICRFPSGEDIRLLINRGCPAFFAAVDLEPIHPSLDNSRRWYNDLFGAGQIDCRDKTCVGFSLTPSIARSLLARYRTGGPVTVRYQMKTRTYEGNAPAMTAVIPGEDDRCFFVTAHAYEPHATNNVSGVAMSLGAAKALQQFIESGAIPRPKHSIRFFHGLENFSLYAWGMSHRENMKSSLGGVSVDSFGRYGAGDKTEHFVLRRCLNIHPSNQHALARELLSRVCAARGIDFEVRESSSNNEELMQDPQFGPPWNLLYGSLWEEPRETYPRCYFYHTDVDTASELSPAMLSAAAMFAAALAYFIADESEPAELAEMAETDWKRIVDEKCCEALRLVDTDTERRRLRGQRLAVWRNLSVKSGMSAIGDPVRAAAFRTYATHQVSSALSVLCGGEPPKMQRVEGTGTVLTRVIPGPLGLGTISEELREHASSLLGYYSREYWCLDSSGANLYHFDGKKSVFEVALAVWSTRPYPVHEDLEGLMSELRRYKGLADILLRAGLAQKVETAPVTIADILEGLHRLGICPGDTLMVHSSLRSFGTVQNGPDSVIDALLAAVTETGIVAMPAFTDCVDGSPREAFDRETSPVEPWIGCIPETFRKRSGVMRSVHPTHSLCAAGLHSDEFLSQREPYDCFAQDGPWGRLLEQGGKILFLGESVGGNTFLHACEAWYNGYLDETYARISTQDGEKTVRITNYPGSCRGGWYTLGRSAPYFRLLQEQGIFRETAVGPATLTVCSAARLANAMREIFEKDPFILLHKSGCRDCARLRGKKHV